MKYIKLFEGFESSAISSILSYISKSVGKKAYEKFLMQLKTLDGHYDIPIGSITDDQVEYLSATKAMLVNTDDDVMNPTGIFCIKYWFSLKNGYIGETGTGTKTMNSKNIGKTMFPKASGGILSQDILEAAQDILNDDDEFNNPFDGVSGGLLEPVRMLSDIKNGDIIISVFDPEEEEPESYVLEYWHEYLIVGKAFISSDRSIYLFNNTFDYDDYPPNRDEYSELYNSFSSCMMIGSTDYDIHYNNIFKLVPDDGNLRFDDVIREEEEDYSVWGYNLPIRTERLKKYLIDWDKGYKSQMTDIMSADFAIILYLDDILVNDNKSDITNGRKSEKENAVALLNNAQYKSININRYIDRLFIKHGFETGELKNLNSIISGLSKVLLINDRAIPSLLDFSKYMQGLVTSDTDKEYYLRALNSEFKSLKKNQFKENNVSKNLEYIKNNGVEYIYDATKKLVDLGNIIQKYVNEHEIKTVYDLIAVTYKLNMIKNLTSTTTIYELSDSLRNIQIRIFNETDIKYALDYCNERYNEVTYKKDLEKIEQLSKVIKSTLK